jgi:hypothetical protein
VAASVCTTGVVQVSAQSALLCCCLPRASSLQGCVLCYVSFSMRTLLILAHRHAVYLFAYKFAAGLVLSLCIL